jgi:hypothetical protein
MKGLLKSTLDNYADWLDRARQPAAAARMKARAKALGEEIEAAEKQQAAGKKAAGS